MRLPRDLYRKYRGVRIMLILELMSGGLCIMQIQEYIQETSGYLYSYHCLCFLERIGCLSFRSSSSPPASYWWAFIIQTRWLEERLLSPITIYDNIFILCFKRVKSWNSFSWIYSSPHILFNKAISVFKNRAGILLSFIRGWYPLWSISNSSW